MRAHGLKWEQESNSRLFEGDKRDRGAVIARSNTNIKSSCWIRTMTLVNGSWVIQEGGDFWKPIPRPVASSQWELPPQRQYDDTLDTISEFFKMLRKRWADVCIEVVQISALGLLQPVGTVNRCRDIIGPVADIEEVPSGFRGVFQHGVDTDSFFDFFDNYVLQPEVQTHSSNSDYSTIYRSPSPRSEPLVSSANPDPTEPDSFSQRHLDSVTADPIEQIETDQNLDPIETDSCSQRNPDTVLNSPSPSTSVDSLLHFTTDYIPLGDETADDQILMPPPGIPATDFTESFSQLSASVTQLSIKQLRTKDSIGDLKNQLLSKIDNLENALAEAHTQQDQFLRDLTDILKEVQDQKVAMIAFREESQEHYSTLREHLAEIIAYINRDRDDKKGESGSSQGPQPPPKDKSRPSGSGGSISEPPRKRGSGGSQSGPRQRDWRYWIGGN
ncbi:hypothetical protein F511_36119 [Dorcoceras hygrometricum]|uniref:Uncharacterized protein n=1 Tax=Dorcoceras hygrometricum TaxID=472368 RepID=A0A2Z7BDN8_9LAMI|nr:hypothetical protein F511_36119 [Dorcoceras hygrometricum]